MRILHTSDWHLGRSFHGFSLHRITDTILREVVETVQEQNIDALLISGDVYDQAQPRTETVGLFSGVLEQLGELGCTVIFTSGNHDSATRLSFASTLLAHTGVYAVGSSQRLHEPVVLARGTQRVAVYPIPYLEPRAVAQQLGTDPSHTAVLKHATELAREDLSRRQVTASIVMAHCFASGGSSSASERDISVGGVGAVPVDIFEGFSYAALGHLHGRQKVSETVRYSGSLLAYSFSEENHVKGGWILDIADSGEVTVSEHRWRTRLPLVTLRGKLADLLADPDYRAYRDSLCRIYITDRERPLGALEKLRERFSTVAELYFEPENAAPVSDTRSVSRAAEAKSLVEVCGDFFEHVRGAQLGQREKDYLANTVDSLRASGGKA